MKTPLLSSEDLAKLATSLRSSNLLLEKAEEIIAKVIRDVFNGIPIPSIGIEHLLQEFRDVAQQEGFNIPKEQISSRQLYCIIRFIAGCNTSS